MKDARAVIFDRIERAMRTSDRSAIPKIIQQLDSDDPAVRLLAISALERLTGETRGYRYDDPRYLRDSAIHRWVDASAAGTAGAAPMPPDARQQHDG